MKTVVLSSSALDGVWCTMSSNNQYRYWHHSQSINGCMGEVDTPLHRQTNKGITSILVIHPKECSMGRWMKTGVLSSSALDGIWCTMSFNHPYRCWHPCQSINECMDEVDTPLYRQPSKGIASILATQHPKDGRTWRKENLHIFSLCFWWCVMYHELQPYVHILHLSQSINGWMCEVNTPLHKQPNKVMAYILAT